MDGMAVTGVPLSSRKASSLSRKGRRSISLPMSYSLVRSVAFCSSQSHSRVTQVQRWKSVGSGAAAAKDILRELYRQLSNQTAICGQHSPGSTHGERKLIGCLQVLQKEISKKNYVKMHVIYWSENKNWDFQMNRSTSISSQRNTCNKDNHKKRNKSPNQNFN